MDKFLEGIQEEDFINSYVSIMQGNDNIKKNELKALQSAFYGMGKSSKAAYDAATDINFEQAKITFGKNHKWKKEETDKLYNFFKNSKAWRDFQNNLIDSDQIKVLLYEINNTDLSIEEIDRLLMSYKTVDEVLETIERK